MRIQQYYDNRDIWIKMIMINIDRRKNEEIKKKLNIRFR